MTLPGLVRANNLNDVVDRERAWDNLGSSLATGDISIPAPSLDLNFAANKSLVDDISGNNLITFSRASTGTFVGSNGLIQTAASGVPRFDHNPATGESLGLLVEEARTNLFTYSEAFGNWNLVRLTVSGDVAVAPNSTTTADKLVEGSTNDNRHARQDVSALTGSYTFSCFMKASERTYGCLYWGTNIAKSALFNLSAGVVTSSSGCVASIQALPNSWYRCVISVTAANENFACVGPATTATNTVYAYQGDGSSGIFVWGAQLEAGAFPTSYIPTTTATVTRATDVASMTGTNFSSWWNGSKQGTLFFNHDLTPETQSATNSNSMIVAFADGLYAYGNVIGYWGSGTARFLTTNFYTATPAEAYNSGNFPSYGVTLSNPGYDKYALAYTPGSGLSKAAINGVLLPAISTPSAYIPTAFYFGGTHTQRIARLAYYPVRLPDAQLQAITAT